MKRLFLAVMLLGIVCSCAHKPEPAPTYESRFHTEKDSLLPNGWKPFTDGFYKAPVAFAVNPYVPQTRYERKNPDPKANTFTVETGESPSMFENSGYYELNDDHHRRLCGRLRQGRILAGRGVLRCRPQPRRRPPSGVRTDPHRHQSRVQKLPLPPVLSRQ